MAGRSWEDGPSVGRNRLLVNATSVEVKHLVWRRESWVLSCARKGKSTCRFAVAIKDTNSKGNCCRRLLGEEGGGEVGGENGGSRGGWGRVAGVIWKGWISFGRGRALLGRSLNLGNFA